MIQPAKSKSTRKRFRPLIIIGIIILVVLVIGLILWQQVFNRPAVNRGSVFDALEKTLAQGLVRDDLVAKGLVVLSSSGGELNVGEIETLVNAGVYAINQDGYLIFGPNHDAQK